MSDTGDKALDKRRELEAEMAHHTPTPDQTELEKILQSVFAFAADKNGSDDYRSAGKMDIPEAQAAISKLMLKERIDELNMAFLRLMGKPYLIDAYKLNDYLTIRLVELTGESKR